MNDCKKHGIFHLVGCDPLCQVMAKFVQNHEGNSDWNERLRHHIQKLRVRITSSIMLHLAKKMCSNNWDNYSGLGNIQIFSQYICYIYI